MKIVYNIYSIYNSGGMERVLSNKANYLADKLNYDIYILTTDQQDKEPFFVFSNKIHFIDLNINYSNPKMQLLPLKIINRIYNKFRHIVRLRRCLNRISPDVCISMCCGEFDFLYLLNRNSKKIVEYHFSKKSKIIAASTPIVKLLQNIRVSFYSIIMRFYDKAVFLTEEDKTNWGKNRKFVVIPNSLVKLPCYFSSLTNKKVVSIGRLDFQKGYDILIKVWQSVVASCPDWSLNIYGSGNNYSLLMDLIRTFHLEHSVFIYPPTNDVSKIYTEASLYVMSSRYEGLPMVLLEAMSYGLPIVSFDCPCGPKDVVKDNGLLVKNGNANDLSKAIIELIKSKELRFKMGRKSIEYSVMYSHEVIMAKWDELFYDILK